MPQLFLRVLSVDGLSEVMCLSNLATLRDMRASEKPQTRIRDKQGNGYFGFGTRDDTEAAIIQFRDYAEQMAQKSLHGELRGGLPSLSPAPARGAVSYGGYVLDLTRPEAAAVVPVRSRLGADNATILPSGRRMQIQEP